MSAERFAACLAFTLSQEGGYVNNPNDSGGATNCGITQATYDAYRAANKLALVPVSGITHAEVAAIYHANYWNAMDCDQLPEPVDLAVFDFGVNAGISRSVRYLQILCDAAPDGVIGPATLAAVAQHDPHDLATGLLQARGHYYQQCVTVNPKNSVFLQGWQNRVKALQQIINQ